VGFAAFLSHSEKDQDLVGPLVDAARAMNVHLYVAERDPQPGVMLRDKVFAKIEECDVMIALLTRDAAESPTVQQEIGSAVAHGKIVIPIFDEGIATEKFPMIAGIEYIKLSRTDTDETIQRIARRLGELSANKSAEKLALGFAIVAMALLIWLATRKS
jgi:nucleoside 2-deoxyribosyltransferase